MAKKKKNKSKTSTNSNHKSAMSKSHIGYARKCRKTKKKIKVLFENLKYMNNVSANHVKDDTVLNNVNSNNVNEDSVVILDDDQPSRKRRLSSSTSTDCKRQKNNTITINDEDDVVITNSGSNTPRKCINPLNCSTPIAKQSTSNLQDGNKTKEINRDSFLTIDLTTETVDCSNVQDTVIDLANTADSRDCTLVSVSNASLSISGESNVTVLENKKFNSDKKMKKFVKGIAQLNSSEKGRLLELITQNIFNGCNVPSRVTSSAKMRPSTSRAPETAENTYIKEVILGQARSRNSIGSNIYNPENDIKNKTGLRMIVIDGSNVAMEHDKGRVFSVKALKICIDYFLRRGHVVKAFVPRFRCKHGMSSDPMLLCELERQGLVVFTPSREIRGRKICSYDDRYIIQCAAEFDGVIVSGDNYRDLVLENPRWRYVIENRVLPFTWVNDMIMFPKDPLGRNGPTLEQFLKHPSNEQIPRVITR